MSDRKVVCPYCAAVNRLPGERLGDRPRCGSCHKELFAGATPELTDATFDRHLAGNDIPLLVDFWAPWCGPCRAMAPAFAEAATRLDPGVRLAKLNTDEHPAVAARFGIRSIPTMILFHEGREVARRSGATTSGDIVRWVESLQVSAA